MKDKKKKKELRTLIGMQVQSLTKEYCQKADESITMNLMDTAEYQKADILFCYVGTEREINTMPIIEDALRRGKTVGVPRCITPGVMEVCRIRRTEELRPGKYGIMEPDQSCKTLLPEELQLVIVPCMACTASGIRLGYGGGYYDRYLPQAECPKIVLCREKILQKDLPKEAHDQLMDIVITECHIFFAENAV